MTSQRHKRQGSPDFLYLNTSGSVSIYIVSQKVYIYWNLKLILVQLISILDCAGLFVEFTEIETNIPYLSGILMLIMG